MSAKKIENLKNWLKSTNKASNQPKTKIYVSKPRKEKAKNEIRTSRNV